MRVLRSSIAIAAPFFAALGCQAPAPPAVAPAALTRQEGSIATLAVASAPPPMPPRPPALEPAVRVPAPKAPPEAAPAPPTTGRDPLLEQVLAGGGVALKDAASNAEQRRFQVLYGIVHEGASPSLERHGYRADTEYFFPASSMKMPIALAMFDRMPALRSSGGPALTRDATITLEAQAGPYVTSLSREVWRALIVSDNFSANRLLGVVGHRELHETLWSLGLGSARVRTGFATGADLEPAEVSPKIEIAVTGGMPLQVIAARRSNLALPPTESSGLEIGKATIVDGHREEHPLSFADKNAIRLRDLQDTLVRIMRPELLPPGSPPDAAAADDLTYLRQALGTLPSESGLAGFQRNVVADYQLVPFLRGIERVRSRGTFKIHSKVGQAFGFLIANAYVVDLETKRSFFLTAAIYANPDETMNDDLYAYDAIAFPALADLGEAIARHAFAGK